MSDRPTEPDEPIDRSLIDAAKPALGPSDAQRSRLKRAVLAAAVGSAAAGTAAVASGTGGATTAGVGLGAKIAITLFAVAAIGGGAWLATREDAPDASTELAPPAASIAPPIEPPVTVVVPPPSTVLETQPVAHPPRIEATETTTMA
ncbi:MAG: hypothetical protein K1X94_33660, partial [Sandaracinaceae bacterium]|nr:hypothetical protein [Sandaracinaceae bacterium]